MLAHFPSDPWIRDVRVADVEQWILDHQGQISRDTPHHCKRETGPHIEQFISNTDTGAKGHEKLMPISFLSVTEICRAS
jgi:hypothetical protein